MLPNKFRVVQVDDLQEGVTYIVSVKDGKGGTGRFTLPFTGFVTKRGHPLVILLSKKETQEVFSIPTHRIVSIETAV